jgi:hypothetical protein
MRVRSKRPSASRNRLKSSGRSSPAASETARTQPKGTSHSLAFLATAADSISTTAAPVAARKSPFSRAVTATRSTDTTSPCTNDAPNPFGTSPDTTISPIRRAGSRAPQNPILKMRSTSGLRSSARSTNPGPGPFATRNQRSLFHAASRENAAPGHSRGRTAPARFRIPSNSRASAATMSQVTILVSRTVSSNHSPETTLRRGAGPLPRALGNTLTRARPCHDAPTSFSATFERRPGALAALVR